MFSFFLPPLERVSESPNYEAHRALRTTKTENPKVWKGNSLSESINCVCTESRLFCNVCYGGNCSRCRRPGPGLWELAVQLDNSPYLTIPCDSTMRRMRSLGLLTRTNITRAGECSWHRKQVSALYCDAYDCFAVTAMIWESVSLNRR